MAYELRLYQRDIIERTVNAKGSVLIEAPTGSGKSVMAREIAKREIQRGGVVLVVAPKIQLLKQLAETFGDLRPEIIHQGKPYDKRHDLFVSTIQTAHRKKLGFDPTMIIVDEVHHGFTGKMIERLLKAFKGRLIGLSATPYDKEGKPLKGFGLHLNDYDTRYMIDRGYLVPVTCYAPVKVDLTGIRTTAGDYNQADLEARFNTIDSVMQVVAATKETITARKQALAFAITIKHAEALADAYNDAGIPAAAMHSKLSDDEKDAIMEAFKRGDLKVLTNPDMLTTGFDHPPTDTVVLARATKSQNLYRQMVGRVLRPFEGKDDAAVLDCAGVIADLGFPTEPIKPRKKRQGGEWAKKRCEACGGDRVYRRVFKDKAVWACPACGHHEPIEPKGGYECEACSRLWGGDGDYHAQNGTLYLRCDCGHETPVSHATPPEELKAIYDPAMVETVKKRFTASYATWLIENRGADIITRAEVIEQFHAVNAYIEKYPERLLKFDEGLIQPDGWRVIPPELYKIERHEPKAARPGPNIEELKKLFYNAVSFTEAVTHLNRLLEAKGQPRLKDWVVAKTLDQLAESPVDGIERMTVKRLKNLYSGGKDCNSIDAFVPYIEKIRGYRAAG